MWPLGWISPSSCWRKVEELKVQHEKIVSPPVTAGKAICLKRQWSEVEPELISHCFTVNMLPSYKLTLLPDAHSCPTGQCYLTRSRLKDLNIFESGCVSNVAVSKACLLAVHVYLASHQLAKRAPITGAVSTTNAHHLMFNIQIPLWVGELDRVPRIHLYQPQPYHSLF